MQSALIPCRNTAVRKLIWSAPRKHKTDGMSSKWHTEWKHTHTHTHNNLRKDWIKTHILRPWMSIELKWKNRKRQNTKDVQLASTLEMHFKRCKISFFFIFLRNRHQLLSNMHRSRVCERGLMIFRPVKRDLTAMNEVRGSTVPLFTSLNSPKTCKQDSMLWTPVKHLRIASYSSVCTPKRLSSKNTYIIDPKSTHKWMFFPTTLLKVSWSLGTWNRWCYCRKPVEKKKYVPEEMRPLPRVM